MTSLRNRPPRIAGLGRSRPEPFEAGGEIDPQTSPAAVPDRAEAPVPDPWPAASGHGDDWATSPVPEAPYEPAAPRIAEGDPTGATASGDQTDGSSPQDARHDSQHVPQHGSRHVDQGPADPGTAPHAAGREPHAADVVQLLADAHDRLRRTPALRHVLDAVVDRLANGTGSDVAILRGDDDSGWHVVAGSGLRTLEVRPLATMPSLLSDLDQTRPVLTVAQTDTVRGELAGLPLSRHRSLLVLRHPQTLVTVLGRPHVFEQADVELVTSMISASMPHLERGWRTEALLLSLVDWFEGEGPTQR